MTDVSTPAKGLIQQTIGSNTNNWGRILNSTLSMIDTALGGTLTKTLSDDIMLTESDIANTGFRFTGVLPSPVTVTFPHFNGMAVISNDTNQTLNCGFVGKYVAVPAGTTSSFWSDGSVFDTMASDFVSRYITLIPASPPAFPLPTFYFEAEPGTQFELASAPATDDTGWVYLYSGNVTGTGNSGDGGVGSGDVETGTSGTAYLYSGSATVFGSSGDAQVITGSSHGPGQKSGDIMLQPGGAGNGAAVGSILLQTLNSNSGDCGDIKITPGVGLTKNGRVIAILPTAVAGSGMKGGDFDFEAGQGDGAAEGGRVYLQGGFGGASGNGGAVFFQAGDGGSTAGNGGLAGLQGGAATSPNGVGGNVVLVSGASDGTNGVGGEILVRTGAGTGTNGISGDLKLTTGQTTGGSGLIIFNTGAAGPTGDSGWIGGATGNVVDGTSGGVNLISGQASGNGNSGEADLTTGNVSGTGTSGAVYVYSGDAPNSTSGMLWFSTGNAGVSGPVLVKSGDASTASGTVVLTTGDIPGNGATGFIDIYSGNNTGTGNSGAVYVRSGSAEVGASGFISILTGDSPSQQSGEVSIVTGSTSIHGDTGNITLWTGNATDGNSGDVTITTGTASTKSGDITLQTGTGGDIFLTPGSGSAVKPGDVAFQGKVGFNTHAPIAKPTVTGSRASGAALQSLITALASYGLVIDSTSA